jgi:hypothetical protein
MTLLSLAPSVVVVCTGSFSKGETALCAADGAMTVFMKRRGRKRRRRMVRRAKPLAAVVLVYLASQWRSHDAIVCGLDQVKVEKVTKAARPSGGTSKLAFMRCNSVHTVCLDDARQWCARDATVWGLDRVRVEKVTNAARPSRGTPKLAFVRSERLHAVCLDDARQWSARDATV